MLVLLACHFFRLSCVCVCLAYARVSNARPRITKEFDSPAGSKAASLWEREKLKIKFTWPRSFRTRKSSFSLVAHLCFCRLWPLSREELVNQCWICFSSSFSLLPPPSPPSQSALATFLNLKRSPMRPTNQWARFERARAKLGLSKSSSSSSLPSPPPPPPPTTTTTKLSPQLPTADNRFLFEST